MTTAEILAEFAKLRVLVVGDVCLDRWCRYDPSLADPSRETGIPRVGVVETEVTPGAAGTAVDHVRLFRLHTAHRWTYRVHEQILPALRDVGANHLVACHLR